VQGADANVEEEAGDLREPLSPDETSDLTHSRAPQAHPITEGL